MAVFNVPTRNSRENCWDTQRITSLFTIETTHLLRESDTKNPINGQSNEIELILQTNCTPFRLDKEKFSLSVGKYREMILRLICENSADIFLMRLPQAVHGMLQRARSHRDNVETVSGSYTPSTHESFRRRNFHIPHPQLHFAWRLSSGTALSLSLPLSKIQQLMWKASDTHIGYRSIDHVNFK